VTDRVPRVAEDRLEDLLFRDRAHLHRVADPGGGIRAARLDRGVEVVSVAEQVAGQRLRDDDARPVRGQRPADLQADGGCRLGGVQLEAGLTPGSG
jgi:hypothetical protein